MLRASAVVPWIFPAFIYVSDPFKNDLTSPFLAIEENEPTILLHFSEKRKSIIPLTYFIYFRKGKDWPLT